MRNAIFLLALLLTSLVFATDGGDEDTQAENNKKPKKGQEIEDLEINTTQPVTYIAAIVRMGDNWQQDSIRAFDLQEKHLAFLEQLRKNNKLIASGPLTTSPDARGLYVFNVQSIGEAEALVAQDEAIKAGWIKMDFHVWASRNYDVQEPITKEAEDGSGVKLGVKGWLAAFFVLVIIVLMLRTFRGVASA